MSSRMDRYYKNELATSDRSSKNKSLYDQIENLENYSNIEGVATIEKTNEIDISKVQDMIKNREEYKRKKRLKSILKEEEEKLDEIQEEEEEPPKNYDIKELLSKMESGVSNDDKSRSLDKEQIEILRDLKKREKYNIEKEEEELKELINTISSTKALADLDVGLLDDLKSDTVVGDASSIKKILEEEKKERNFENTNTEIDKSFYTSSFGFTKKDFEELKNINHNIKKSNKLIIVLLIIFIILLVSGTVLFFAFK